MRIIVAPESYTLSSGEVACFLAGGITGCVVWQEEVIEQLKRLEEIDEDLNRLVIFNPRRSEWPTDANEIQKQIQWEHDSLEASDIFSMYFVNSESVQPICLYELGKHTTLWRLKYGELATSFMTIGIEDGYKRTLDVKMQMTCDHLEGAIRLNATPLIHATAIASCLKEYLTWKRKESKYSNAEYDPYDKYFHGGNRSFAVADAFNHSWNHHSHCQYWGLLEDDPKSGELDTTKYLEGEENKNE